MTQLQSTLRSLLARAALLIIFACNAGTLIYASVPTDSYGGPGGRQFSSLTQIHPENLDDLEVAWTFQTGDLGQGFAYKKHSMQTNPKLWNGVMFITTSANWLIAIDAATGEEKWRYEADIPFDIGYSESSSRGASLWHGQSDSCPHRVFLPTLIGELHALNAETGEPCSDFGRDGRVDLSVGVGEVSFGDYALTSPPVVIGDRLIVGSAIGDNRGAQLERGVVRAIDAVTGKTLWSWDPIPVSPDQPSYSSWENDSATRTGAANVWPPLSVDPKLGLVFLSTGSPSPDFYGGERLGDNLYANSLVALSTVDGSMVWHQQLVHHDVWDYDIPAQPTLSSINTEKGPVAAVLVVTKSGMLYGFSRSSGEPIWHVEERAVPESDVAGERLSPTQPFSSFPALTEQQALGEDDLFGLSSWDRRSCRRVLEKSRSEGIFTPPSLQGTVMSPGYAGGANWGGIAVDEAKQIGIAHVNQIPALVRLIPREEIQALRESGQLDDWDIGFQVGTPYVMARKFFLSSLGLPCSRPPWNKLLAMDLENQRILWEVPLGTVRDLAPAFVPNLNWGSPGVGGPLLTASGLIVIGGAAEHKLRIFDATNGEELWAFNLPTAALATPVSYEIDGIQYISVAVGGHDNLDMKRGDWIFTFKLRETNP